MLNVNVVNVSAPSLQSQTDMSGVPSRLGGSDDAAAVAARRGESSDRAGVPAWPGRPGAVQQEDTGSPLQAQLPHHGCPPL